jgi:hypothetical protein
MELFLILLRAIVDAFGRNTRVVIGCALLLGVLWFLRLVSVL